MKRSFNIGDKVVYNGKVTFSVNGKDVIFEERYIGNLQSLSELCMEEGFTVKYKAKEITV